ncbi:restriction endonuclease subunit S [Albibacterium profundi]|uniref:Restriction endonuclease subunit S n=1 Tax=Albibacterium profundi TaxID=3134906 RepID=A0ABV5CGM5_9SPHI
MQTYDSYKSSGIDWLGEIPSHWECKRLGNWFEERREKVSDKDFEPLSVTKNGIVPQLENAAKSNDGDNRKLVKMGDFVINSRSDRKGSSGLSPLDGSVSLINIVMKPRNVSGVFINHLLKSNGFIEEFYRNGHGIVADLWTTRYDEMKFIHLAIPPISEQEAIAAFLDEKCGKIDELVSVKEQQIALLKERRQIIIHEAVTKGLDTQVEMKDSGIDWIGEIPEHWEVKKIKYLFSVIGGGTPSKERAQFWNGDIPWVSPKDMKFKNITTTEDNITKEAVENSSTTLVKKGSLLVVVRSGILQRTIPLAFANLDLTINQDLKAFIQVSYMNTNYLYLFIKGCENFLLNEWVKAGATVESIEVQLMLNHLIILPPLHEQEQIVTYLEEQTSQIDLAIVKKTEQIAKLKEYKQSLINEVVTGKVRVA